MIPLALLLAAPVQAHGSAACPMTVAPPRELAGWRTPATVRAGPQPVTLILGRAVQATLLPTTRLRFPVAPAKPGGPDARAGLFAFDVEAPGRYRVAIGAGAWIEVVARGKAVASAAHAHGPACSGIAKMVDFDLAPGRHLLEIAAAPGPALRVIVVKLDQPSARG